MGRNFMIARAQGVATLAVPHVELSSSYRWCHTASWERNCISTADDLFTRSVACVSARDRPSQRDIAPHPISDREVMIEKVWGEFFSDTSQWWDHRSEKVNPRYPDVKHKRTRRQSSEKFSPRYPDFKHKRTGQSLWLDNFTPPWVEAELATMAPGLLQIHNFSWNLRLRRHLEAQDYDKTLNLFRQMQRDGMMLDKFTFVPVLNACSKLRSLEEGRRIHEQIILRGCESDIYVATGLVDMYAKCGSIEDAWSVFNKMGERDVVSWSAMIGGYVKSEQGLKALELFRKMQQEGVEANTVTFVGALNACASVRALEDGKHVHAQIIQRGLESNVYVSTCLVDMYAKCGIIEDAWSVFHKMRERNVVCWNAMIVGYVKSEQGLKALGLLVTMQQEGVEPNTATFVGMLNACASVVALEEGRRVHKQIIQRGFASDAHVANSLVDMYAKCGSIEDAWSVFNNMQERDVVSWSAMIRGCVKSEQGLKALELFNNMQQEGVQPNTVTFVGVLNACASVAALEEGRRIHEQIIRSRCESDVYVSNCLVDMYAKCGSMENAWSVFNKIRKRDVVAWNAMIGAYVKCEQGLMVLKLFRQMQQEGVEPNTVTFVGALNACASISALEEGRSLHEQIIWRHCESDVYVANSLIDMYCKCGSIEDSWSVFNNMQERDVVSWNAMIGGCLKWEQELKALQLFWKMQQEGVEPDAVSFVAALNACASVAVLEEGKLVHERIIQRGWECDLYVATCLVDMYAKCGSIEEAWLVFNKMREHDVVSWSAIIMGYVKSKQGLKALDLFRKMEQEGVEPDAVTFVAVLNACASSLALEEGKRVHRQIISGACKCNVYVAACLVDMFAKCGSIKDACNVFNKLSDRNVVSWSAMIGGYAMHGHPKKAIALFKRMGKEGVEINQIIFTCLLSACSHGGLVKEGLRYFNTITSHYTVLPTREQYACMVDLLGRAGWLDDAEEMMKKMPMHKDSCIWMSLLGACRIHGNINMAERAAKGLWELDPENASAHMLLLQTYAAAGKWGRCAIIGKGNV